MASIKDQAYITKERERNTAVRKFTMDFFKNAGFKATDSQANFIFVNLNRTAKEFRDACAQSGVQVGRDFPPMEKTWSRVSIGTMAEMQKATAVFAKVLGAPTTSASRG
jgi:histidinol-phosphate aminotransferase